MAAAAAGGQKKPIRNRTALVHKLVAALLVFSACAVVVRDRGSVVFVQVALRLPPRTAPTITRTTTSPPKTEEVVRPPYDAADCRWEVRWESVAASLATVASSGVARVGVLNFNSSEVARWRSALPAADVKAVALEPVAGDVTWDDLYPQWVDEDNPGRGRGCPSLPDPAAPPSPRGYDLVAVKLPCGETEGGWSRDVRRLHLQLSAAKLAVGGVNGSSSAAAAANVLVLSAAECLPLPNLFPCKHLAARHGHAWLYRPDAAYLRRRLRLPVGACQLALRPPPPESAPAAATTSRPPPHRREAYATVLHSGDAYVCGAIALAQSIRQSGSARDLVALVDDEGVGPAQRAALAAAGWRVRAAARIRNPRAVARAYNEWNYSKFRLWQLTDYDAVVFLDADLLVLRNMDFLFDGDGGVELGATANNGGRFNSGVMVLEPCNCTFELLMAGVHAIESYNGGDQGYLNEVFTWWHRLPRRANLLKYAWNGGGDLDGSDDGAPRLPERVMEEAYAVHYLGVKPWLCYRDYDCNWDVPALRRFASDEAHEIWWAVHDRIRPAALAREFCALPAGQVALLERGRREARRAGAADGHWNRTVTDPRAHYEPSPML